MIQDVEEKVAQSDIRWQVMMAMLSITAGYI